MQFIVNNTAFISPLDLIVPHSCEGCGRIGMPLCNRCKNDIIASHQNICPNCKTPIIAQKCQKCRTLPPTFIIANRDSIVGSLVHDLKYHSVRAAAKSLAELANQVLPNILDPITIVPLPTVAQHVRTRGLDHTMLVAKHLAKLRQSWRIDRMLVRAKDSVQVGASESIRLSQAKKAYAINPKNRVDQNTTYLLLDDVWTTGASMKAACKLLESAGAEKMMILSLTMSLPKY